MDLNGQGKRAWLGPLVALFIPGSAHWLAGDKRTGVILLVSVNVIPFLGLGLMSAPHAAALPCGLGALLVSAILYLFVIASSYRPQPRVTVKGALLFLLAYLALTIANQALIVVQPAAAYKLPTGGMRPTLAGARASTDLSPSWLDGRALVESHARRSGPVDQVAVLNNALTFQIQGEEHTLPAVLLSEGFRLKPAYEEGEIIWSGVIAAGDHMIMNKHAYLFQEPRRGDIVVFGTKGITHPGVRTDTAFVKRIAGLPGETVSIRDGHLTINGEKVNAPAVFQHLRYGNDGRLSNAQDVITLEANEYLMLGDNTAPNMSLDGRFFGPIHRNAILGRIATIYWPFDRIGPVE